MKKTTLFLAINSALSVVLGFCAFLLLNQLAAPKISVHADSNPKDLVFLQKLADIQDKVASKKREFKAITYSQLAETWETMPFYERRFALKILICDDPLGGWEFLNHTSVQEAEVYRCLAIRELAAIDPGKASALYNIGTDTGENRENRLLALISGWLRKDISEAANFLVASANDTIVSTTIYQRVITQMLRTMDMAAVLAWVDRFDGTAFEHVLQEAMPRLYEIDPDRLARWAIARADQPGMKRMIIPLIKRYAEYSPDAAINMVSAMRDGDAKWNAIIALSSTLAHIDQDRLADWITTLSNPRYRDLANGQYAQEIVKTNVFEAIKRLDLIDSESLRARYARAVMRQAWERNPGELTRIMSTTRVSGLVKETFAELAQRKS